MIQDLFSHKIHSTGPEWPDKLVELAAIFHRFDGAVYNRTAIERELLEISPRTAYAATAVRDRSKFRDEISAYPAYLGVYHLRQSDQGWRLFLSQTAKDYLLCEEPDVGAFLRLQLALFQYPNAMGVHYYAQSNRLRLQANAASRTRSFIGAGFHLSPLRLVVAALQADRQLRECAFLESRVTFREVVGLANEETVFRSASPSLKAVARALRKIRLGEITPPTHFEKRFHLLRHLELFEVRPHQITYRRCSDIEDERELERKIDVLSSLETQFEGFDDATTTVALKAAIEAGTWADYFDGARTLGAEEVTVLGSDQTLFERQNAQPVAQNEPTPVAGSYQLRPRPDELPIPQLRTREQQLADPEQTRIKRQRRSLAHKKLVHLIHEHLRRVGSEPQENAHIDLFGAIPHDGRFLFEMKSGGESLLDQIRKGVSQLYEYRFRYRQQVGDDVHLCLVLPNEPREIPWLEEYLCGDRGILICWPDGVGGLAFPATCRDVLRPLTHGEGAN